MKTKGGKVYLEEMTGFFKNGIKLPWFELMNFLLQQIKNVKKGLTGNGIYEVLEYETVLELLDREGIEATIYKRQKVRYLHDHIIAYQDQAWGDGEILVDYKCSPGHPVDRYQFGHKTIILISLREEKTKGDIDEFNIQWGMKDGFRKPVESWSTVNQHMTKNLKVRVIFPESRPPLAVTILAGKRRKEHTLGDISKIKLPDGRWQVTWEMSKPKLYEEYILKWKW